MDKIKEELEWISYLLKKMETELLTKEEYQYLQYLLIRREASYSNKYPTCKTTITGDKLMFLSDTHHGNARTENKRLISIAYNKALQQNIKTVVHAGDLLEACSVNHDKKYEVVYNELCTALQCMPSELTTKLLLGNHDYTAIRTYPKIIPYFFGNEPKLEILGMQKVLLNWDNKADICIYHPINQLKEANIDEAKEIIKLEGHHHYYEFMEEERKINIPSLSNEATGILSFILYKKGFHFCPLFIIASKQDEKTLLFEIYCVDEKQYGNLMKSEEIALNTETKQLKLYK